MWELIFLAAFWVGVGGVMVSGDSGVPLSRDSETVRGGDR